MGFNIGTRFKSYINYYPLTERKTVMRRAIALDQMAWIGGSGAYWAVVVKDGRLWAIRK